MWLLSISTPSTPLAVFLHLCSSPCFLGVPCFRCLHPTSSLTCLCHHHPYCSYETIDTFLHSLLSRRALPLLSSPCFVVCIMLPPRAIPLWLHSALCLHFAPCLNHHHPCFSCETIDICLHPQPPICVLPLSSRHLCNTLIFGGKL